MIASGLGYLDKLLLGHSLCRPRLGRCECMCRDARKAGDNDIQEGAEDLTLDEVRDTS